MMLETGATDSMRAPLVSVVMNCFNSAAYLGEALASVLAQSCEDWELVFWDNRSTDRSAEIFRSYDDPRFRYFQADAHTSLGEARNLAVSQAKGIWVAFLDCDDKWAPDRLEIQLRHAECADKEVGLIYGPVQLEIEAEGEKRTALERYYRRQAVRPHGSMRIYDALLEGNFVIFSTLLMRRALYLEVGGIDSRLSQNEDYDLLLKVSRLTKAVCVNSVCATYRIHGLNNSHAQVELNFRENIEILGALPPSASVRRALRINASRYAFYRIGRGDLLSGLKMLLADGSPSWALRRACVRLVQGLHLVQKS